jgi:hypothetical protein
MVNEPSSAQSKAETTIAIKPPQQTEPQAEARAAVEEDE